MDTSAAQLPAGQQQLEAAARYMRALGDPTRLHILQLLLHGERSVSELAEGRQMGYDLAIVGSGGGAFAATIAAVRKDKRAVMVEAETVGGTCVNVGCIPSKALVAAAEARDTAGEARFPGIRTQAGPVDLADLIAGKDDIVEGMRREKYLELIDDYDWELVEGRARFVEGPALEINGRRLEANHYVVATGSTPWAPPNEGLEEVDYLTSTAAMELQELPTSMIVVGANYVGLEMGQVFARLGTEVTLLEALDRIAPQEEPEISHTLTGQGLSVHAG